MRSHATPADDANESYVRQMTEFQGLIHTFVLSLLPGCSDVDDVVQEINVVLWKKRDAFEPGTNFKAWALTIARYQVMAFRKKMALRRTSMLTNEALELVASDVAEQEPELLTRQYQALRMCFEKLSSPDRELILCRYWHNTPLRDFAAQTKRNEQTLKGTLRRIRLMLKQCITRSVSLSCRDL